VHAAQADTFIPEYLKAIQKLPQRFSPLAPIPVFPPAEYLKTFLPAKLIQHLGSLHLPMILSQPPPLNASETPIYPPLTSTSYHTHFLPLLQDDLAAVALTKADIVLWNISVRFAESSTHQADRPPTPSGPHIGSEFALFVPGIRENHPRVDVGDLVHMREVFDAWKTGSGLSFEGRLTVLKKREGIIRKKFHFFWICTLELTVVKRFGFPVLNYIYRSIACFLQLQRTSFPCISMCLL
jgi:hypothetical protein